MTQSTQPEVDKPVNPSDQLNPESNASRCSGHVDHQDKVVPDEIVFPSDGRLIVHVSIPEAEVIQVRTSGASGNRKIPRKLGWPKSLFDID